MSNHSLMDPSAPPDAALKDVLVELERKENAESQMGRLGYLLYVLGLTLLAVQTFFSIPQFASFAGGPQIQLAGAFISLLCVAYLMAAQARRRRDVTRNEMRLLRLEIMRASALHEASNG